jgi:hypothetical protein
MTAPSMVPHMKAQGLLLGVQWRWQWQWRKVQLAMVQPSYAHLGTTLSQGPASGSAFSTMQLWRHVLHRRYQDMLDVAVLLITMASFDVCPDACFSQSSLNRRPASNVY